MPQETTQTRAVVAIVPPPPPIRLDSIGRVRLELAKLYRAARAGEIQTGDASRLGFLLLSIGKLIEAEVLEQRITALETSK